MRLKKVRIQIRKVNSKEVFTSYLGIEIRILVTDAEICEHSIKSGQIDGRKNWSIKSLYRDEDVRCLIQNKV